MTTTAAQWQSLLYSINKKLAYYGESLIDKNGNDRGTAGDISTIQFFSQLNSGDYLTAKFIYALQSKLLYLKNLFYPITIFDNPYADWSSDTDFFNQVGGGFRRSVTNLNDIKIETKANCTSGDIVGSWLYNDLHRINEKIKYAYSAEGTVVSFIKRKTGISGNSNLIESAKNDAITKYNNSIEQITGYTTNVYAGSGSTAKIEYRKINQQYKATLSTQYIYDSNYKNIALEQVYILPAKIVGAVKYINNSDITELINGEGLLDGTLNIVKINEIIINGYFTYIPVSSVFSGEDNPTSHPNTADFPSPITSCNEGTCEAINVPKNLNKYHKILRFIIEIL